MGYYPKKIFSLANFSNLRWKWSHLATLRYWDHFDCMDDFCGLCWNGGSITLSMINANIGIKILGLESKYSGSFWNLDQHGSNLSPILCHGGVTTPISSLPLACLPMSFCMLTSKVWTSN